MRLVYVEWLDSYGCSASWQHLSAAKDSAPMLCRSVGWLLHDTKECKIVVPHVSDVGHPTITPQGCGDMTIPTKAIVHLLDLQIPKIKRKRNS